MMESTAYSVETARAAAGEGQLERWMVEFLASPGSDNADLAHQLRDEGLEWIGPLELPLDELHRLAGSGDDVPALVEVDEDDWRDDVYEMADKVEEGWEPAPLVVVQRHGGQFVLEDGNHRAESLRRAGETTAWVILGFETHEERVAFEASR